MGSIVVRITKIPYFDFLIINHSMSYHLRIIIMIQQDEKFIKIKKPYTSPSTINTEIKTGRYIHHCRVPSKPLYKLGTYDMMILACPLFSSTLWG